jgi:putative copper resistance protein D
MGGLLWLVTFDRRDGAGFVASAHRVSRLALASVMLVAASGILQTLLFLDSPLDLFRSSYGALVLVKVAGLLVLIAFGAHHRKLALPALVADSTASAQMAVILRREVVVMALVIAAGALLAYVPPSMSTPPKSGSPSISANQ